MSAIKSGSPLRCVRCGGEGHLSKDCPWTLKLPHQG